MKTKTPNITKKLIIIVWILMPLFNLSLHSQNYHPFPEENALYNATRYNIFGAGYDLEFGHIIQGDTIIGSKLYAKVYTYTHIFRSLDYFAAIRENSNKQVFIKLPGFEEEMLYDFNLTTGDEMYYTIGGFYDDFQQYNHSQTVTTVDSVQLENGEFRKRWIFDSEGDVWVEGIGSIRRHGLPGPLINLSTLDGTMYEFACFMHNDTILYLANPFCDFCQCFAVVDVTEQDQGIKDIIVSPNPADGYIIVKIHENHKIYQISMRDLTGRVVRETECLSSSIQITLDDLKPGVYSIEFLNHDGLRTDVQKLVIN